MSRRDGAADEALVRRIFEEHGAAMLAYAARLTGDRARGEAVVQDVLLRVWRHPEILAGPARASLFATIRDIAGGAPAGEAMAMLGAVEALPPEHRDVLNVLYFQGRDIAEASASLGVPAGAVKERSYQALRQLRAAVAG
ncbi:sigma factor-like helix-turn-helix DNA-binding protein [Paractinoplanes durhamensis]|uniref:DNA-directed RNA polymerase sigma-70 factor n=1 Tax=Paractinoplanes durhamensis TaxID=113563 RepID=A0ABQ3YYV6_9ACTN|nr:sigma factor-like helix-turn-helix DNA-binding protein [Actinoplanes durhamensis]GIE02775.1 DNA-directed RNA polymerase sigma-70 factor [Actinoplanes durhamensis]